MQISELKLAKELIRKPSITPKDAGAINLLAKNLRSLGFNCKVINFKMLKIYMQSLENLLLIFVMLDTQMLCLQET